MNGKEGLNREKLTQIYGTRIPQLLKLVRASSDVQQAFRSRILAMPFDNEPKTAESFFSKVEGTLSHTLKDLSEKEQPIWDKEGAELFVDSLSISQRFDEEYPDIAGRTVKTYLQGKDLPIPQVDTNEAQGKAVALTEEENAAISARIVQMIKVDKDKLTVSPNTAKIAVTREKETTDINSEFFQDANNDHKTIYARVGNLFFIDASYKDILPQEIQSFAKTNIIFINDIQNSEFSDSLGYYTANTLASLMASTLEGSTVLDCGTGSGPLALAAKRLGAKAVVGVDVKSDAIEKARTNASVNEDQSITFVEADLKDKGTVISSVERHSSKNPVVIISNIGSWSDYAITNITGFSYIPDLRTRGYTVSEVVCGGYVIGLAGMGIQYFANEQSFLLEHNLRVDPEGIILAEYERRILEKLGFRKEADAQSEKSLTSGQFPRIALSQLVKAA